MSDEERTEASVTTPAGSASFKGKKTAEFITVLLAVGVGIMAYVLWAHERKSYDDRADMKTVLHKLSESIDNNAKEQRITNCLIAAPQNERSVEFCNRVVR